MKPSAIAATVFEPVRHRGDIRLYNKQLMCCGNRLYPIFSSTWKHLQISGYCMDFVTSIKPENLEIMRFDSYIYVAKSKLIDF